MNAFIMRPLLGFFPIFLSALLTFTLKVHNSYGFDREPSEEKKSSAQPEINYDDPNLAMTSDYVTENVVFCTYDENDSASDSKERCHQVMNVIKTNAARSVPISPVISDTLYLVDAVNSRKSILLENEKRK